MSAKKNPHNSQQKKRKTPRIYIHHIQKYKPVSMQTSLVKGEEVRAGEKIMFEMKRKK
jgi:hypothetical protein